MQDLKVNTKELPQPHINFIHSSRHELSVRKLIWTASQDPRPPLQQGPHHIPTSFPWASPDTWTSPLRKGRLLLPLDTSIAGLRMVLSTGQHGLCFAANWGSHQLLGILVLSFLKTVLLSNCSGRLTPGKCKKLLYKQSQSTSKTMIHTRQFLMSCLLYFIQKHHLKIHEKLTKKKPRVIQFRLLKLRCSERVWAVMCS